jgi:hypothetical protein
MRYRAWSETRIWILSEWLRRADLRDSLSTVIARIYIGHGNRDRAFEWLDTPVIDLRLAAEMTPD